jgi:poly(A) polymerase
VVEALRRANDILLPHCRYFSIAQRIRQQAREILAGCFRLARGTGLRGEARFLHHPLTPQCLELFSLYVPEHPELAELSDRWRRLVGGVPASPEPPAREKRPRRRRRRSRSRAPRTAPETEKNEP